MRPSAALLLVLGLAGPAAAAEPTLERVLLTTGGVGWLGFRAEGGDVRLRVPLAQVDDVLKSLVVLDGAEGVRGVTLDGPTPVDDPFRGAPFGPGDLAGLPQLLARLRGAEVEVAGPVALRGRVLSVAPEEIPQDGTGERAVRHRLSLLTETGIRSAVLENLDSLGLADPELRERLRRTLAALADAQLQPDREIAVGLEGTAAGADVRFGYLAEMPVWKASYQLVADEGKGDGLLQGWAILDNQSGQDWREVDVTLVAGSPAALRQALYRSYFVARPEVPVLPGLPVEEPPRPLAAEAARSADAAAVAAPELERAAAEELTAQTLYRLARPVTLPRGRTLMAPLADRRVPVARLARYRAGQASPHPEAALRVANPGGTSLPGGIATLHERLPDGRLAFVGDAALPPLAPDEVAVLAYGRDGNVEIDRREDGSRGIERVKIVDGVLEISRVERLNTVYLTTPSFRGAGRELVIEQDVPPGWRVTVPAAATVEGGKVRLQVTLTGASDRRDEIVVERTEAERVALADADVDRLLVEVAGAASPELSSAMNRLAGFGTRAAALERLIAAAEAKRAERVAEQERLRANLSVVPSGGDLARRYLDRLGASENEIAALEGEAEAHRAQRERVLEERRAFLRGLRL